MKKKVLFLALTLVAGILFIPTVHAMNFEQVESLKPADTYVNGAEEIVGNGTKEVTITYNYASFKMVKENPSISRNTDGAWAGVRVYAPKDLEEATLKNAQYRHNATEGYTNWWNNRDSKDKDCEEQGTYYFDYYGLITSDILNQFAAKKSTFRYTWLIDWDGDSQDDQTVNLILNPQTFTLYDLEENDNEEPIWAEEEYLTASNQIRVDYSVTVNDYSGFGSSLYLDKNTKLTEEILRAELEKNFEGTKYEVLGFYADEEMTEAFDFTKELSENAIVYIKVTTEATTSEDKGPDTADTNIYGLLAIILVSGLGLGYVVRKRMN